MDRIMKNRFVSRVVVPASAVALTAGMALADPIAITLPVAPADIAGGVTTAGSGMLTTLIPIIVGFALVWKFVFRAKNSV